MNGRMVRMETTRQRPWRPATAFQAALDEMFSDWAFCSLGPLQRLLLIALIAKADRHGRGMARPSMLRVAAYDGLPVSEDQTEFMLEDIAVVLSGSKYDLAVYMVDGNRFYAFRRWFEFVNLDYVPKESRYPDPPLPEVPA